MSLLKFFNMNGYVFRKRTSKHRYIKVGFKKDLLTLFTKLETLDLYKRLFLVSVKINQYWYLI